MKNLGVTKWNLLPFVIQSAKHFVGFLVGRVKEVFLWKQSFQLSVRRTQAFLSYLGWAKNEILNLVDLSTLGTSRFKEVVSVANDLGKMRAEHFSVKFLLIAPSR